jgi:8-oxo-dGTP diphosphatase
MEIKQKILVTAIIVKDNKILLQRRTDDLETHKGKWTTPSGTVKINEHPQDAIIREVKEELDVDIEIISVIPSIDSFPNHKDKYHLVYLSYLCKIMNGEPTNIDQDGDVSELKWCDVSKIYNEDLIRGTLPPIQKCIDLKLL